MESGFRVQSRIVNGELGLLVPLWIAFFSFFFGFEYGTEARVSVAAAFSRTPAALES